MPWGVCKLNDGNEIPGIAFGTDKSHQGRAAIDAIKQALSVGYTLIDTAQLYRNEEEVGKAIKESRVGRKNIFIVEGTRYTVNTVILEGQTSGYSHIHGVDTDIPTSIRDSLKFLDVPYVDLYLIHYPAAAVPDIPTSWRHLEDFRRKGWTKSIGVSNFDIPQLKILLASARTKPAVHQIILHPYVYPTQGPIIEFSKANGIVIEAYGTLTPLWILTGGPLDKPLAEITKRRGVTPEKILLAWAKGKGADVVVTASSKKERLQGYLDAGDIVLTDSEIAVIDAAGKEGAVDPPTHPEPPRRH